MLNAPPPLQGAQRARGREAAITIGLFAVAAAYFSVGSRSGIELTDTGMLVYPSWLVARGAVPWRDFLHLLAPAGFAMNGALLRWFGADLAVIRAAFVIVNALVAVLIYAAARLGAGRPAALLAYALTVAVWGGPRWVFTTPYPNHCAVAFILLALLAVATPHRRFFAAWAFAGLCCGVAATFKQTSGVFALLGLGLFLIWDPTPGGLAEFPGGPRMARALRAVFLVAAFALSVAYLWPANTAWNVVILFGPAASAFAVLAAREWRGTIGTPERGAWGLLAVAIGFALPIAAWAAYFASHDALAAAYFSTIGGLPALIRWFEPLPPPPPRVLLLTGLVLLAALALRGARAGGSRLARRIGAGIVLAVVGVVAALLAQFAGAPERFGELGWAATLLPLLAVWGALPLVFPELVAWLPAPARPMAAPQIFALFASMGMMSLLLFYPSADLPHLLMGLPLFMPLVAMLAARWYRVAGATGRLGRVVAALFVAATATIIAAPFVHLLVSGAVAAAAPASFARARGVRGAGARFEAAAELVRYLDAQAPELPLFVLGNEQLLYFLSARDSILPREEYLLYLVGFGAIADGDVRAHLPADRIIERLTSARPIVVDYSDGRADRFRHAFPEVAAFLAAHYRLTRVIGPYRVLGWAG